MRVREKVQVSQSRESIPAAHIYKEPDKTLSSMRNVISKHDLKDEEIIQGQVYKANWMHTPVVIKKFNDLEINEVQDFLNELQKIVSLYHYYLVDVKGCSQGEKENDFWLVTDYMPDGTLASYLQAIKEGKKKPLSWPQMVNLGLKLAQGLHYLHTQSIVHGHLSPENIYIDESGVPIAKIGNIGFARFKPAPTSHWQTPETLFHCNEPSSAAQDIYSLGMVLWQLAASMHPFAELSETAERIISGNMEMMSSRWPEGYWNLIEQCWLLSENYRQARLKIGFSVPEDDKYYGSRPTTKEVIESLQKMHQQVIEEASPLPKLPIEGQTSPFQLEVDASIEIHGNKKFYIQPATDQDKAMVIESYNLCPVPGYEVSSVRVVFNRHTVRRFNHHLDSLAQRINVPQQYSPRWTLEKDAEARREIDHVFYKMSKNYFDPRYPMLRVYGTWHGTNSQQAVDHIMKEGYGVRKVSNGALLGQGFYSTGEAGYAGTVYQDGHATVSLIFNYVATYSSLPAMVGDIVELRGRNHYQNYDAHVTLMKPESSAPNTRYLPCKSAEEGVYSEIVVFETAAILPRFIVNLQPSNNEPSHTTKLPPSSSFLSTTPSLFNIKHNLIQKLNSTKNKYICLQDGVSVISADRTGKLYAWNLKEGSRMQTWQAHAGEIDEIQEEINEETGTHVIITAGKEDGALLTWYFDGSHYKEYDNDLDNYKANHLAVGS